MNTNNNVYTIIYTTVIVRLWNPGYMEGMMLAILFMNTMAPLIDHCVVTSHINRRMKKVKTA